MENFRTLVGKLSAVIRLRRSRAPSEPHPFADDRPLPFSREAPPERKTEDLKTLVGRLNPICHRALERAAQLCVRHTHFSVEIEHFLLGLLEAKHCDLALVCAAQGVAADRLRAQLTEAVEGFQRGNDKAPVLAPPLVNMLAASWTVASQEMALSAIRSGAILKALLDNEWHRVTCFGSAPVLALIWQRLREDLPAIMHGGVEDGLGLVQSPAAPGRDPGAAVLNSQPQTGRAAPRAGRLLRQAHQQVWQDPATQCRRRSLSPTGGAPLQLVEVTLQPGAEADYPTVAYSYLNHQIWVLSGRLLLTEGQDRYDLAEGDSFEFGQPADRGFANPGPTECRYLVALVAPG